MKLSSKLQFQGNSSLRNEISFPPIVTLKRDNANHKYLFSPKDLEKYGKLVISLYPISDGRLLQVTEKLYKSINSLYNNHGAKYTVTYLKEANRLVQFFIAGNPQRSEIPRVVGEAKGLPVILSRCHRELLHKYNGETHRDYQNVLRVILSLLQSYRIMIYPGELKLHTITEHSDSKGINPGELGYVASTKFSKLLAVPKPHLSESPLLSLTTAGPNHKISLLSATFDAFALRGTNILKDLQILCDYFKLETYNLLMKEIEAISGYEVNDSFRLGKLSIKEEPAGKQRVFAIVDIGTQSILKPIHDHVFSILKLIPQDGAFDQLSPVRRLISSNKEGKTFCYDLSAATDRFPISVQVDVLSHLYNREVAEAGKRALVNRPYYLKKLDTSCYYNAGQPMGALSSGGVFSLAHHFIVQIAATRVGIRHGFTEYALLGDDIVITNEEVATEYYKIMVDELKVSINKAKSLQSNIGVMEFAKRIIGPKGDLSPIGPKNIALTLSNKLHLPSLIIDWREKVEGIDFFLVRKLLSTLSQASICSFNGIEKQAMIGSLSRPFGFLTTYTLTPLKWRKRFGNFEVESNLTKLLQFIEEEWYAQRTQSLTSLRRCIDLYKGGRPIGDIFVDTMTLPSMREQRLKLMEEYLRVYSLEYPIIEFSVNGLLPDPKSGFTGNNSNDQAFQADMLSLSGCTLDIKGSLIDNQTGEKKRVFSRAFELMKPHFAFSEVLYYLSEALPELTPKTSVFDNNNIKRKSLRHVSYKFLKKFIKFADNK